MLIPGKKRISVSMHLENMFLIKCYVNDFVLSLFNQIISQNSTMKTKRILFVIALAFILSGVISAQDCGYYSMSKGMVLGYQNLDAKGKVTGTQRTTCLDVSSVGAATLYKIKGEYSDAKDNLTTRELEMRCEDGNFYMDMQNLVDPKAMEGFKDMEVSVDANAMMYPSVLIAGQTLPDAAITISAATGGVKIMNMVINITNRKVIGFESVTVPAGTFDCYKITYDVETKMMFKIANSVTEYVNMGVGNVKTETLDKKGKLAASTVLIEMSK